MSTFVNTTVFVCVRAWKENEERLEQVDRIGLNVSEVINEVQEHLGRHVRLGMGYLPAADLSVDIF